MSCRRIEEFISVRLGTKETRERERKRWERRFGGKGKAQRWETVMDVGRFLP